MSKKNVENPNSKIPKKIMVFGTFDGLHRGHLDFFKQAKRLAPGAYLVVSVARDRNVLDIKGRLPKRREKERLGAVEKSPLVNKAVLAGLREHLPHILRERPDIIALGYDQKAYIKNLKKDLSERGLEVKLVRLLPFRPDIYKSHLLA